MYASTVRRFKARRALDTTVSPLLRGAVVPPKAALAGNLEVVESHNAQPVATFAAHDVVDVNSHTSDLTQRFGQHNHGVTKSTKNRGPWELVHREEFGMRGEAMRRERFLKSGQGREELKKLLKA